LLVLFSFVRMIRLSAQGPAARGTKTVVLDDVRRAQAKFGVTTTGFKHRGRKRESV
jgi:hypothetical protein